MKTLHFMRRLHLYLGIILVPWLLMYATGAFVLNHRPLVDSWFQSDQPEWTKAYEQEYHRPVAADADLRAVGVEMLRDFGLEGRSFHAWWQNGNKRELAVTVFSFLSTTRLTYSVEQGRVVAEDRAFRLDRMLVGMHERGGFMQAPWLTKAWGAICDVVGLALLTWVISGLYVWWRTHRRRLAGGLVLAAGAVSFAILVARL